MAYPLRNSLIEVPADEDLGPEMRKLSINHRRFVLALVALGGKGSSGEGKGYGEAAAMAGYGGTDNSQRVAGSRLHARPDVQAAILEEARSLGKVHLIKAVMTEVGMLESSVPAVALKAAENIQNRHGMAMAQQVNITHTVQLKTTAQLQDELRRLREDLMDENESVAKRLPPSIIEGEFSEVEGSSDGLEDILAPSGASAG